MASAEESEAPPAAAPEVPVVESKPQPRKVMICVDESEDSHVALEWAIKNVVHNGDAVQIVHAVKPVDAAPFMGEAAVYLPANKLVEMEEQQKEYGKRVVQKAILKCREEKVNAKGELRLGEPREAICRAVEEEKADLLVMGSHGYGALKRALLGSVSSYCVNHAKCPVLVVPKDRK